MAGIKSMISFEAGIFSSNGVILRFPTPKKEGSLNLLVKLEVGKEPVVNGRFAWLTQPFRAMK